MPNPQLEIEPLNPVIGAIVHGVELSTAQSEETIAAIRAAFLRHKVLFFRNQTLTPVEQRDFAKSFGQLHIHPVYPQVDSVPEILILDNSADNPTDNANWHTDVTFIETPPLAGLLYAVKLPPSGGDTLWSSMTKAYEALSPAFQDFLSKHEAIHDFAHSFPPESQVSLNAGDDGYARARRENPPVTHPVIRTHPETGLPGLFVNSGFTTKIKGLSDRESALLLKYLFEHIQQPEFLVRWRWKPGDIAFWDNRCTQHYAVNDYLPHRRVMYRATVLGDRPFFRSVEASS